MNFLNDNLIKVVPEALGNKDAAVYIEKLSARGMAIYAEELKEKNIKSDADLFVLIAKKVENFNLEDATSGEIKELKTAEEVVDIPGISPLISEVVQKFSDINFFGGAQKNAQKLSTH